MCVANKIMPQPSHPILNYCTKEYIRKNCISKLPVNFYENILILETSLFQTLDMNTLDELLKLYMSGVDYYGFRDPDKALGFQSRANWLLSKPEVMNFLQQKEDIKKIEKEASDFESCNIIKTLKKRISVQKKLILENEKESLQDQCQTIIKDLVSFNEERAKVDSLLQEEFSYQRSNLIEKLKQKKAANLVSSYSNNSPPSNITIATSNDNSNSTNNNNDIQHSSLYDITEINSNSSHTPNGSQMGEIIEETSIEEGNGNQNDINERIILSMMSKDLDLSDAKQQKTNGTLTINKTSPNTMSYLTNIINTQLIKGIFGAKQKEMLFVIKEKIDEYLYSYNEYFYEEHYQSATKKIEQLFAEKYHKYIQISKTYQDQIKETQYELSNTTALSDEQIDLIVFSLSEEKDHELSKLDDEYNNLLNGYIGSFKALGFQHNKISVRYLQEKAKLDIYNCLLSLFIS